MIVKVYSISEIAIAWGESRQLVNYYRKEGIIKPDFETKAGPIWLKIPARPKRKKPGPKPKNKK